MISFSKELIFLLAIIALVSKVRSFDIVHTSIEHNNPGHSAHVGSTVRLNCKSDSSYEFCIWQHNGRVCKFEWKRKHYAVKMQTCTALDTRVNFVGNYKTHECKIELKNAQISDSGQWSCEMEPYVWGPARASSHKDYLNVQIVLAPEKSTPTTIATSQQFADAEANGTTVENKSVDNMTFNNTTSTIAGSTGRLHNTTTATTTDSYDYEFNQSYGRDLPLNSDDEQQMENGDSFGLNPPVSTDEKQQRKNDSSYGTNLPLSSNDEEQMEDTIKINSAGTPTLAIVLTLFGILLSVGIVVVVWVYARKRKGQSDIELQWRASQDSNKETYNDEEDVSKQLRDKSEREAILPEISDDVEISTDGNLRVYNGSTAYSFNSKQ